MLIKKIREFFNIEDLSKINECIIVTYQGYKHSSYMDKYLDNKNHVLGKDVEVLTIKENNSFEKNSFIVADVVTSIFQYPKKVYFIIDPYLGTSIKKNRERIVDNFINIFSKVKYMLDSAEKDRGIFSKILIKKRIYNYSFIGIDNLDKVYTSVYFRGDRFNSKNVLEFFQIVGMPDGTFNEKPKEFVFSKEEKEKLKKINI